MQLALEVNFYAGTRELYDAEPSLDAGGLYALIDGLGLYRGEQPVAGPCPIDITLLVENIGLSLDHNFIYASGEFESSESLVSMKELYLHKPGDGGRDLRVQLTPKGEVDVAPLHERLGLFALHNQPIQKESEIGRFLAYRLKPDLDHPESELVSFTAVEVVLLESGDFTLVLKEGQFSHATVSISSVVKSINDNLEWTQKAIAAEEKARQQADASLTSALQSETTARTESDSAIRSDLSKEAIAREQADASLTSALQSETADRQAADTSIRSDLSEEVTARQQADNSLQSAITAEAKFREDVDTDLNSAISAEAASRQAADRELERSFISDIQKEIADRKSGDSAEASARQKAITAEESARKSADETLQSAIAALSEEVSQIETSSGGTTADLTALTLRVSQAESAITATEEDIVEIREQISTFSPGPEWEAN